ncbi:potassium-transporting ATPase subunit A [Sinomicrobium sp. FJxs]|uniref:Potassium-transporting ATPase potassium-binding subunit n=1 Tax=Sinomicrobium weinanense TaxID=2842200 RepID=A0A926JTS8_9FLAO|nr:potassium-transporting ATPase subunit KdpA [Sinomicrobium weinanense]MBC9797239.1 potassium-transporting ATPase subunit A [Sinomicrobium weinanense]MBU3122359.1 potassium-transporting ATPase subunit A [Sinomicrobium weinanense]
MIQYEIIGAALVFLLSAALAWPLGKFIVKVFLGEKNWMGFMSPIEKLIFKISGVNPDKEMDWKQNMKALLGLNLLFFLAAFVILSIQGLIKFWNPVGIGNWEPTLAFNTAISFMTNTNLQHYSGETGASYFTQLAVFAWLQFVSAGTGITACALLFRGLTNRSSAALGNFYNLWLKSCTRILLPLAVILSLILTVSGTTTNFKGLQEVSTLEGETQMVAGGPTAPMVAIKQLGTNGGGYFGPNSTHPFENPTYLANMAENIAIILVPMALVFAFGFYIKRKRLGLYLFGVMSLLFVSFVAISAWQEVEGNPNFAKMGLEQTVNMEGKEVRLGPVASSMWGVSTTSTSNGSVNSMHDSHTPLSGGIFLLDMFINAIYGGVGVGFINFFVFMVIAVFIAGQMIGRTPDFLGKKLEAREIKIAAIVVILHPLFILAGTAISSYLVTADPELGWLNNPGFHGFSEMMYEFTSSSANNGSGFEGLGDNTPFWNIATGLVMLFARFLPIIGPLAIVGSLAVKKHVPQTAGSLQLETPAFASVLLAVIIIISALAFFPALTLGPIAEYFTF